MRENMIKGVDVSHHQAPKVFNYNALVDEGFSWLIARAAYGDRKDKFFEQHIEGALKAGLRVGAYLFFRQTVGMVQFEQFAKHVEWMANQAGDKAIAPVVDLEWNQEYDGTVSPKLFEKAELGMNQLRMQFGETIAYLAPGFYETLDKPEWLLSYPWWVAHYTKRDKPWCPWKDWVMWQHTSTFKSKAYKSPIDANVSIALPPLTRTSVPPEEAAIVSPPPASVQIVEPSIYERIAQAHEHLAGLYRRLEEE